MVGRPSPQGAAFQNKVRMYNKIATKLKHLNKQGVTWVEIFPNFNVIVKILLVDIIKAKPPPQMSLLFESLKSIACLQMKKLQNDAQPPHVSLEE